MRTKIILMGLVVLTMFTFSCNQTNAGKPKNFDYGQVTKNTYSNEFFGLKIALPSNWIVQSKEQTEQIANVGKEMVAGDDKNLKAAITASEINSANLLAVFKYEVGSAVNYNPSFMLVAENLQNFPGIKNGRDYLFQTVKLLKQSQLKYDVIDEDFKKVMINGQEFYLMNCELTYMGITMNQLYYCTIQNGFCISAVISFVDDEQKNELEKIINAMTFNK